MTDTKQIAQTKPKSRPKCLRCGAPYGSKRVCLDEKTYKVWLEHYYKKV